MAEVRGSTDCQGLLLSPFNLLSADPRYPCPSTDVARRTQICIEAQRKLNTALVTYLQFKRSANPNKDIVNFIAIMAHVAVKGTETPQILVGFKTSDIETLDGDSNEVFADLAKISAGAGLLFGPLEDAQRFQYRIKKNTPHFKLCVRVEPKKA